MNNIFEISAFPLLQSQYCPLLKNALLIAQEAGNVMLDYFRSSRLESHEKSNASDIVTEADEKVESLVRDIIKSLYPDHGIISEESDDIEGKSEFCWIIDPIDGTTNFSQGLPIFNISIAIELKGETILGVVYAPYLKELFYTIKGAGAYFNGNRIGVSGKPELREAVVATGLPYDKKENPDNNLREVATIAPEVRALRRLGSAALDLAYVACGYFDAYWELDLKKWDVAAGVLLIQESGGEIYHIRRNRNYSILASTPLLSSSLLELLLTPVIKSI